MAIHRARAKYGRTTELRRWHFYVRGIKRGINAPVLEFRADSEDHAVHLDPS